MVRRQAPSVRCAFCAKSQEQVGRIIAGPKVYICDSCSILGHGRLRALSRADRTRGFLCFACLDAVRAASESESSNGQ